MFWGEFAPAVLVSSKVAYNMYFELKQNLETEAPLGELSRRQKKWPQPRKPHKLSVDKK